MNNKILALDIIHPVSNKLFRIKVIEIDSNSKIKFFKDKLFWIDSYDSKNKIIDSVNKKHVFKIYFQNNSWNKVEFETPPRSN
jgi:hypothetical protein